METIEATQYNLDAIKQALAITRNITLIIDFKCCVIGLLLSSPCPVYIYWRVLDNLSKEELQTIKEIFSTVNCLSCKYTLEIVPCSDKLSLISSIVQGIISSIELDLGTLKNNAYQSFLRTLDKECETITPPVDPVNPGNCCYRFK